MSTQVPTVGPPDVPVDVGTGTSPAIVRRPVEFPRPRGCQGPLSTSRNRCRSGSSTGWPMFGWRSDDPEEPGPPAAFWSCRRTWNRWSPVSRWGRRLRSHPSRLRNLARRRRPAPFARGGVGPAVIKWNLVDGRIWARQAADRQAVAETLRSRRPPKYRSGRRQRASRSSLASSD